MNLRSKIETIFDGKAFLLPLFYSYPGGLRFELSEGGSGIDRFLLALRKATTICADIFSPDGPVTVCLRVIGNPNLFAHRNMLSELRSAGITIPRVRPWWLEANTQDDGFAVEDNLSWLHIPFETSGSLLQTFLWCAFANDFGSIRPRPLCDIYLFNLNNPVMVLPYDHRGMDIVGPNHRLLSDIYFKHHQHLLDYGGHF